MIYLILFKTYIFLIAALIVAAALAAIPAAIILKKLGLSKYWALVLFLIFLTTPLISVFVFNYVHSSFATSLSLPTLSGILKLIEWTPGLIFLWAIALYSSPKERAS